MMRDDPAPEPNHRFIAHATDTTVVPIPFDPGHILVPRWNHNHEAPGWSLCGADLSLPGGRPYGSLWYVRHSDGRRVRVGVRWDVEHEVPQCAYVHATDGVPATDRDTFDAVAVELDAQARITALLSINAFLFAQIAPRGTEDAILDAAGLGLPRVDEAPEPSA